MVLLRQRLNQTLVAITLILAAWAHYNTHQEVAGRAGSLGEPFKSVWVEPVVTLDSIRRMPINRETWAVNFLPIERIVLRFGMRHQDEVPIDLSTHGMLEQVYNTVQGELDQKNHQRMLFLVRKSLPDARGKVIAQLIERYFMYRQEQTRRLREYHQGSPEDQRLFLLSSLTNIQELQERHFGNEVATALFAQSNITYHFLMQSRYVGMQQELSQGQKADRRKALQVKYKRALAELKAN